MKSSHKYKYKISVLLVTYNHARFIRQALTTIFNQHINGPIELVVADDSSEDATRDLIREFEDKSSRFCFKYLETTSNIGITRNYQRGFNACNGEYIAVLEGDDYWIHPLKLQRQCEFLDSHWECDLCAVNHFVYEKDRSKFTPKAKIGLGYQYIDARELIINNLIGNFSTCMYRKSAIDKLPKEIYDIISYDWIVNICVARNRLIGFLREPMTIYRLHDKGVWTQTSSVDKMKEQLEVLPAYDKLTNYQYKEEFAVLEKSLKRRLSTLQAEKYVVPANKLLSKFIINIDDFLPPIIILIVKYLLPPKIKRLANRMIHRGTK